MIRPLAILCLSAALGAQGPGMPPSTTLETRDEAATQLDRIGAIIDPELEFIDERGYPFKLAQWFPGEHPVVLMLGYYSCPRMCGQILDATLDALSQIDLRPGEDYRILSVSIDPDETPDVARNRKGVFLPRLTKAGGDDAWHLLVGKEQQIAALTTATGFQHYWSNATQQFAHPSSLIFLTPQGKVSRILVDKFFAPEDVRLALVEASDGRLGTFWDRLQLNCLTFDPRTNTYSLAAMTLMRIGGGLTVLVIAGMVVHMLRRERRNRQQDTLAAEPAAASTR